MVYGTLKLGRGNNRFLKNSTLLGKASTVKKYEMTQSGIPFVNEHKPFSIIHGEVWEVSEEDMGPIDRLEGYTGKEENSFYYRKPIPVVLENGEKLEAEIYFSNSVGNQLVENGIY